MIGSVIGVHKLLEKLGEGGMGVVYRARDEVLGRLTAVKMLHPHLSQQKQIVARFFNEAKAAAALRHPGIVEIYEFGYHDDGAAYLAMEHLEGESLQARMTRGLLPIADTLRIASQVASALSAAHRQQIVHRDLKPDNIFLVPDPDMPAGERIKLLDFGIAKLAGDAEAHGVLTRTGTVMGTPSFMAPEQCRGASDVDARADLYAMGCILFAMLCGRVPFPGELAGDVIAAQIRDPPPRPRDYRPEMSAELEVLILRLLDKDPSARVQSSDELREALRARMADATPPHEQDPVPVVRTSKTDTRTDAPKLRHGPEWAKTEVAEKSVPATAMPLATPVARTTLGGAAGETETPKQAGPRRKVVLLAMGGAAVAVAGAAFIVTSMNNGDAKSELAAGQRTFIAEPDAGTTAPGTPAINLDAAPTGPAALNPWVRIDPPTATLVLGVPADTPNDVTGFRPARGIAAPSEPYEIQVHEVTWAEFDPERREKEGSTLPAVGIEQPMAAAHCRSIGGSLPSEEQWEYAARGPTLRPWPWGATAPSTEQARIYRGPSARVGQVGVGADRTPGAKPIFDMLGNAREWTADVYRADLAGVDERWTRRNGIKYAIRGMPLAAAPPKTDHPVGLAYRSALCGEGPCLARTEAYRATVGFRCVRSIK